jgi:hypothetical protein
MHELLTHLLPAKARRPCDAHTTLSYFTVNRTYFYRILRENRLYSLDLLSRERLFFRPVVEFIMIGSVCGVSLRRVSRHVGTDVIDEGFDTHLKDGFEGIDWTRLPQYMKPLASVRTKRSWVYRYGWRVALIKDPDRIFFVSLPQAQDYRLRRRRHI